MAAPDPRGISNYRAALDRIDAQILALLAERQAVATELGPWKKAQGRAAHDQERELSLFEERVAKALQVGLPAHWLRLLFQCILEMSKEAQQTAGGIPYFTAQPVEPATMRGNLLDLCAAVARDYQSYGRSSGADATSSYLDWECETLLSFASNLPPGGAVLDIGCATGHTLRTLHDAVGNRFAAYRGLDLSPAMIARARGADRCGEFAEIVEHDLAQGLPAAWCRRDATLAIMNLGTASEIANLAPVLQQVARECLVPGGGLFLSFYNRDALVRQWRLPWPSTLSALYNPSNNTLEVAFGLDGQGRPRTYIVYARAERVADVEELLRRCVEPSSARILSYPTLLSVIPSIFYQSPGAIQQVKQMDDTLARLAPAGGAYLVAMARTQL